MDVCARTPSDHDLHLASGAHACAYPSGLITSPLCSFVHPFSYSFIISPLRLSFSSRSSFLLFDHHLSYPFIILPLSLRSSFFSSSIIHPLRSSFVILVCFFIFSHCVPSPFFVTSLPHTWRDTVLARSHQNHHAKVSPFCHGFRQVGTQFLPFLKMLTQIDPIS